MSLTARTPNSVRVRAPSRLHFGMLSFSAKETGPNEHGAATLTGRQFGGAGLMIEEPGLELVAELAKEWTAEGPLAGRALAFARRFAESLPAVRVQPHHLRVTRAAPEHMGLGSGTQLGMAVAQALAFSQGLEEVSAIDLAKRVGRGTRSALGIYGFAQGSFLVESGKLQPTKISPLVARVAFPEAWRVVLILPPGAKGLHGGEEEEAFSRLHGQPMDQPTTDSLCRLVLLGMLPALAEGDCDAFGEAVYEFNVKVGAAFAPVQGGVYANPRVAELVAWMRKQGARGVGQSSWGPAVFAIVPDQDVASLLVQMVQQEFSLSHSNVILTRACNTGAVIELPR